MQTLCEPSPSPLLKKSMGPSGFGTDAKYIVRATQGASLNGKPRPVLSHLVVIGADYNC